MPVRKKLLFIALVFFAFILFFPAQQTLNFLSTAFLVVACFLYNPFKEKLQLFKERQYIWWMLGFFALILLSVALSANRHSGLRYLDSRLALLYLPLSVGLIRPEKKFRDQFLLCFAVIITLFTLVCLGNAIYRSVTLHDTAFLYNDSFSEPVTGHQSIYLSLLVNIAIYIYTYTLFSRTFQRYNGLFVLAILLLFICSFLLASRNLMLVLYASTLIFALWYFFKRKKYLEGATLIMGLVIGVFLIFKFFPQTLNRFKELAYTQFDFQKDGAESHYNVAVAAGQWNGANTRLAVWQCGWQLFKQEPLLGVNLGDKKDKLMGVYKEKNFQFAIRTQKNLHSNYFDILVSLGITGLVIFLIGWIFLPLRVAWRHKDSLALLIMLTFAFAMITENYFDRSLGGMLFAFFIPFLLSDKKSKS